METHWIPASDLHQVVERLKQKDEHNKGKTGLEQQFEVMIIILKFTSSFSK